MAKRFLILIGILLAVCANAVLAVDINGQLKRAQLEKLSSDPTGSAARIYYNTTANTSKYYDGTSWQSFYSTKEILTGSSTNSTFTFKIFPNTGCSGGTSGSNVNLQATKIGDTVMVFVRTMVSATAGTNCTVYRSDTAIPATYRPAANVLASTIARNNGANLDSGIAILDTNGMIYIQRDGAGSVYGASAGDSGSNTSVLFVFTN